MLMLAALLLVVPVGPVAQTPTASPPPQVVPIQTCPSPRPRFAAIAIDPTAEINVNASQHFVVGLRVVADAGYSWRLMTTPPPAGVVRAEGTQTVWDVALQNLERKPGEAPVTGGAATEMFLFTAMQPGPATLPFGLFAPGADAPARTVVFTARVSPDVTCR